MAPPTRPPTACSLTSHRAARFDSRLAAGLRDALGAVSDADELDTILRDLHHEGVWVVAVLKTDHVGTVGLRWHVANPIRIHPGLPTLLGLRLERRPLGLLLANLHSIHHTLGATPRGEPPGLEA